ncbi:MAG: DNA-3-methyladenine glycosylase I [Gammaproteobacteria bacterium]|nr:DNA-3-methyladenine glycosylase I [Gammaproteobacteria bacterium]MCP4090181.1 DNA-3-methyladenine glycosylase I [Gammaproteobacteria bacterium]MCP4277952.1 DNA-3-methyladenine glycosylase I [Gammaproteobacteria bacterium]MCP4832547.1 DNA-3-methyladenine glycosylase I [Gammaproteobacteria bacterium]MCP4928671.1 DNA-3-methyladenine glycosylase I [Gammaproteobacteria bacterium]
MLVNKKIIRCSWSLAVSDAYQAYHDKEWGVPAYDDQTQFEFLLLEGAQAGLSWSTVLHKREGYRKAFANFDPIKVSRFTDKHLEERIQNPAIIRNRLKIKAAVTNAQAFLMVQAEFGSFSDYIWGFVDGMPVQNSWRSQKQIPVTSPASDALSKDLKKRGFKFVGSTIMYAHMQATGMVNDHVTSCYRHEACRKLGDN